MSQPFGSFPFDASGVDNYSHPLFITAERAPTTNDIKPPGTRWMDGSVSPKIVYESAGAGVWNEGGNAMATTAKAGIVLTDNTITGADDNTTVGTSKAIYDYGQTLVIAGANIATDITQGIGFTSTEAQAIAREPNTATEAYFVSPEDLDAVFASISAPIGSLVADAGTFTDLTADGTGTVSLGSNAAADLTVTGAFDLTLASTGGSLVVQADEAVDDAINLNSSAGGLDVDVALLAAITSTRNNAQAILLESTAGGIDILASGSGGAGEDIDVICTGGSVNISGTENVADAVTIAAASGGIDITCGGAAGEDIDIANTAGSVHIVSGEAVTDSFNLDSSGGVDVDAVGVIALTSTSNGASAIAIEATIGGVDILASGAAAGEDINIVATGSSVNVTSTEDAAQSIYIRANGGTSETVDIHSDLGTGVASVNVHSDVGGVTIDSGLASADAININASDAGGGVDIDSGTAGFIVDTTGGISLDSAAASNFTATGAFDLSIISTAGSVVVNAEQAVADAIQLTSAAGGLDATVALQMNLESSQAATTAIVINASNAAGGIDADCGSGGFIVDAAAGAVSLDSALASNFTVTGAADLSLISTAGSVVVNAEEAVDDSIQFTSAAGGLAASVALSCVIASTETNADSVQLTSAGGMDITATGAAAKDLDIVCTSGSLNASAGEADAAAVVVNASAGGLQLLAGGGAGLDTLITNTSGSMTLSAGESASDAFAITCGGAASGITLTAGTNSISLASGQVVKVTALTNADTPYTVLGTDYFLSCDTSAGVLQVTLPAATAKSGVSYVVKDIGGSAGANNITINGGGTNLLGGGAAAATKVISTNYAGARVTSNGTVWAYEYIA